MFGQSNIKKSAKIYAYLQNGDFRFKEAGTQRITVKDADFSGTAFSGSGWEYFDFINCDFYGRIMLKWIGDCTFTDCHFRGMLGFGDAENCRFLNCKVEPAYIGFNGKSVGLLFENCEFYNPDGAPNHRRGVTSAGEMALVGCKGTNFAWGGHKKLTLRHCTTQAVRLGTALPGLFSDKSKMPYSTVLIEDCDLTRGVDVENGEYQSFTLRNSKVGVLKTIGSTALGDVLIEGIKEGHVDLSASDFRGKLTVRNCSFYQSYDGYNFQCSGDVPAYTLIENIVSGPIPVNVISAPDSTTEKDFLPQASNKSFIIRNCQIPNLHVNWAQTDYLRIENCRFSYLDIKDSRIGRLEIIGCSLAKLNVSRTQVKEQDVRVQEGGKISWHVTITEGSNIKLQPR